MGYMNCNGDSLDETVNVLLETNLVFLVVARNHDATRNELHGPTSCIRDMRTGFRLGSQRITAHTVSVIYFDMIGCLLRCTDFDHHDTESGVDASFCVQCSNRS